MTTSDARQDAGGRFEVSLDPINPEEHRRQGDEHARAGDAAWEQDQLQKAGPAAHGGGPIL